MKILIACEYSGVVRDAFVAKGHDAWSCDILPTESLGNHYQCDVREILNYSWDMMIAHPPCTHLACSGAAWFKNKKELQVEALDFIRLLLDAPIPKIALENPVGVISTRIRKPDQVIQPYYFGEPFQKSTCLWLKNLPKLVATHCDAPLFGMTVDKGEMYVSPSGKRMAKWYAMLRADGNRAKIRSKTFQGIADAMANQWG